MKDTRELILDAAIDIANERSLSALSVRAVAEALGLSPGNVSYHVRRKDVLIFALVQRLNERNRGRFDHPVDSIGAFLEIFRQHFGSQYEHRGLLLALPEIVATYPEIADYYRGREEHRRARLLALLTGLRARGALEGSDFELARLVSQITLNARFWLGEAKVSYPTTPLERIMAHYLALIADNLRPYATACSRAELDSYSSGWIAPGPA